MIVTSGIKEGAIGLKPRPRSRPIMVAIALYAVVASVAAASLVGSRAPARGTPPVAPAHAADTCPATGKTGKGAVTAAYQEPAAPAQPEAKKEDEENPEAENSKGCVSCHEGVEPSHPPGVFSGATCIGCHGGDGKALDKDKAHVLPRYPKIWGTAEGRSGNPERTYSILNRERPEFIRFMNPGDLRIAHLSCGASGCHASVVRNTRKSMMTHGAMLYGAALYNNGAVPVKDPLFGESYSFHGTPQRIQQVPPPTPEDTLRRGILPFLDPLPRWEISQVGNVLRAFERGGLKKGEVGNPLREEEPGRPDAKLSFRGHGTLLRTDPTVLGIQKTRLFDPTLNFLGTNDQPGDYRSGGCTACHNVYANDRDAAHSAMYAQFGHLGRSFSKDSALEDAVKNGERGHPITHTMTNGIPTSQCITCHMHPGTNMLTTFLGYTWWDNETDGGLMYPKQPLHSSARRRDEIQQRNPEGAAVKGLWGDRDFLERVSELNPKLQRTQFADFHGHGWVYRAVYKQDRKGNLLDSNGGGVSFSDPDRFKKAVHLKDIHLEKGMHCVDCHFRQDTHGNGSLYGEPRAAIEIDCADCHGTVRKKADLALNLDAVKSTGLAGGNDLKEYKVRWGEEQVDRWYVKDDGRLFQRSGVKQDQEWEVPQIVDTITPGHPRYSEKSRVAKTIRRDGRTWGSVPAADAELAHADSMMTCYSCHSAWTTACFGCHLNMTANQKKPQLHNEGGSSRNWTSYNFQTLRDDLYMLGKDGSVTRNRVAPIRSSCAVQVSSQNQNREWIYYQQQTVSAEGFAGTAFSSYVPHTVRGKETKACTDCHLSDRNDNNAWLANLMLLGSNAVNFIGRYCYVATGDGFEAVMVAERDEPAAVIGSTLHHLAYPDRYQRHLQRERKLHTAHEHGGRTVHLQLRGEYLYAAEGERGLRVYDVANVDNKAFSERIVTAPVSPLGQRFFVDSKYATSVAAPSTMALDPVRTQRPENQEGKIHPLYGYLFVTDRYEGLIVVPAATLLDGNPTNNFLRRALTWNPDGILKGASRVEIAGAYAYVTCDRGLVILNLDDPLRPKMAASVPLAGARAVAVQFRYAFVCTQKGLEVVDVTDPARPMLVPGASVELASANDVYVSRTYAYVAAGEQGVVIVDVENPERPRVDQLFTASGLINDARAVKVAMTNNSTFAYIADGRNGLRVVQLTSPETTPGIYGYSPRPSPTLIATYPTTEPALAVSEGLDRDRAVDESGNQLAVFGRRGARPFNGEEMRRLYLRDGRPYVVSDLPPAPPVQSPAYVERQDRLAWAPALLVVPLAAFLMRRRRMRNAQRANTARSAGKV